jgi:hypothetical protein
VSLRPAGVVKVGEAAGGVELPVVQERPCLVMVDGGLLRRALGRGGLVVASEGVQALLLGLVERQGLVTFAVAHAIGPRGTGEAISPAWLVTGSMARWKPARRAAWVCWLMLISSSVYTI